MKDKKSRRCGHCKQKGHNVRACVALERLAEDMFEAEMVNLLDAEAALFTGAK